MDGFRFTCVTAYRIELTNGFMVGAISDDGPVRLRFYGKRNAPDILTLLNVAGSRIRRDQVYVVREFDVEERFGGLRKSFLRLAAGLFVVDVGFKGYLTLNPVVGILHELCLSDGMERLLLFCLSFLKENGIFNEAGLVEYYRKLIRRLEKREGLSLPEKRELFEYFLVRIENYLGDEVKSKFIVRRALS